MERTYVVQTRSGNVYLFDSVHRKGSNGNYEDARRTLRRHLGMLGNRLEIDVRLADKHDMSWIQY